MPAIKSNMSVGQKKSEIITSPLPHFIIIGSCKSGTTRLYDDIATHPLAFMPDIKEPSILHLAKTKKAVADAYRHHFNGRTTGQFCGEASTAYTMTPQQCDIASFARECLPHDVKLIYIMRNPISRIISHLAHDYSAGRIPAGDFNAQVLSEPRYVDWSRYDMQLKPWVEAFGPDKILCISFEHFIINRRSVMNAVCSHLGIDPAGITIKNNISNKRGTLYVGRFKFVSFISESLFYKIFLAKLMPAKLRLVFKHVLKRKKNIPDFKLSAKTVQALKARLDDPMSKLDSLGLSVVGYGSLNAIEKAGKTE